MQAAGGLLSDVAMGAAALGGAVARRALVPAGVDVEDGPVRALEEVPEVGLGEAARVRPRVRVRVREAADVDAAADADDLGELADVGALGGVVEAVEQGRVEGDGEAAVLVRRRATAF